MSSRSNRIVAVVAALALMACSRTPNNETAALRVCSDPNNLPFSNQRGEGFENHLASLVANEMHAKVQYTWWAERRGFVRNTLGADKCDIILGVPAGYGPVRTTHPYYRSAYVFVSRAGIAPFTSLDDPRLRTMRIGVQMIGDGGVNTPPAHALAKRGIVRNVVGYQVAGDYRQPNPPARIVDAVARGDVDVALVWGPLAGYFAAREPVPLVVSPVTDASATLGLPFAFDIAVGVRKRDTALARNVDAILSRRRAAVDSILAEYRVPRTGGAE